MLGFQFQDFFIFKMFLHFTSKYLIFQDA